MNSPSWCKAG